eukprot:3252681-Pyramimonas_sp.AAC.1
MFSAKPIDYWTPSGHIAGITNFQTKAWVSAEAAAKPFASHRMGSREGRFGRTDRRGPSEHDDIMSTSNRIHASSTPLDKKASENTFYLTEGDSSV